MLASLYQGDGRCENDREERKTYRLTNFGNISELIQDVQIDSKNKPKHERDVNKKNRLGTQSRLARSREHRKRRKG